MKKVFVVMAAALLTLGAFAQDGAKSNIKIYGFVRNYAHFDTKECVAGTADLFSYLPKDSEKNVNNFHFTAITSRLGVDVSGYQFKKMSVGAKIEADFYAGLSGVTGTATFRLRQAFLTMGWKDLGEASNSMSLKIGQAWHPLAADMPDVFSLNTGAPFGPFARTPLAQFDYNFGKFATLTAALIWQMQYTSCGPDGASANYVKYCGIPEMYIGATKSFNGGIVRLGVDITTIKPYKDQAKNLSSVSPFLYAQYKKDKFSIKAKTVFAQDGSHINLTGGYGVAADGSFTPSRNSSSWISLAYGKKVQGILFAGYVKNFGTTKALKSESEYWFQKNSFSNVNSLFRVTPSVIWNLGKLQLGIEYEVTGAQYGDKAQGMNLNNGLYEKGLHWVVNNRVQTLVKFSF